MDRSILKNRRVRFQRISDAKFFTGWVRAISSHGLIVTVGATAPVQPGDQFSFQIYGSGVCAIFKGNLTVCSSTELSFTIVDAPMLVKNNEEVRMLVQEMAGMVRGANGQCEVLVIDVSATGVGVLLGEPIERGDTVQLTIDSPQGQVVFSGDVRYCRKNLNSYGQYRAGLSITPENRVDAVRWQRVLLSEAA